GNIALLQRLEEVVTALDRPSAASLSTETFRLRYADATQLAENIRELYAADASRTAAGGRQQNPFQQFMQRQQGGRQQGGNQRGGAQPGRQGAGAGGGGGAGSATSSANLRVSANTQQNAITVVAEPEIIAQIREQIDTFWDRPLPDEA